MIKETHQPDSFIRSGKRTRTFIIKAHNKVYIIVMNKYSLRKVTMLMCTKKHRSNENVNSSTISSIHSTMLLLTIHYDSPAAIKHEIV